MFINKKKQFISLSSIGADFSRMVSGFSLVELVIVVVIAALSSAIAVPIVSSNDKKAKLSEADAGLTNLRTQLRIYYSQNGVYPSEETVVSVKGASWNDIAAGSLTGRYFTDDSYKYVSETGTDFILSCAGGQVLSSDRNLNQIGVFSGGN